MDRTQNIALGFAVVLAAVTALSFIPGLTDAEGAPSASSSSTSSTTSCTPPPPGALSPGYVEARRRHFPQDLRHALFPRRRLGSSSGSGFLDLGIIRNGILDWPLSFKILASAPHLILGGVAMFSGFVLGKD